MLRAIAAVCAVALFAVSCPAAHALTYATAGELRDDCAAVPAMLRGERAALSAAGECIAFIDGARGMAETLGSRERRRTVCIPEDVSDVDLALIYVRSIDQQPVRRTERAAASVHRTLAGAFPCDD